MAQNRLNGQQVDEGETFVVKKKKIKTEVSSVILR